jgi:hypothetical protein
VFPKRAFANLCVAALLIAAGLFPSEAIADDDVEVFQVYDWSSLGKPDAETSSNCRSISKTKKEAGWAVARREVAIVSTLELPDEQEEGTAYRIFVDYCVRVDNGRERPVGAMTFRAAPAEDLGNVQRWGSRHYKKTSRTKRRTPKPGREHFDPPDFTRND